MKSDVSLGGTSVPPSSMSCIVDLEVDLFTNELTSCQNLRGLSFRFANLSCMKAARAFLIALFASVLSSRALGRRWCFPLRRASWNIVSRSARSSMSSLVIQAGWFKRVTIFLIGHSLLAQLIMIW